MKLIKLMMILLIFAGGVYTGNVYLPQKAPASPATVSIPGAYTNGTNTALFNLTSALKAVEKIYSSLPEEMKLSLSPEKQTVEGALLLQELNVKKYKYEAEIAKAIDAITPSAAFTQSASEYTAAKKEYEKYILSITPQEPSPHGDPAAEGTPPFAEQVEK